MTENTSLPRSAVYGTPPPELADVPAGAIQTSPLRPGAMLLEDLAGAGLDEIVMAAPPGSIERRYTLALALQALGPGGRLTALAPKDKGGARLSAELADFGCDVAETYRRRQRICTVTRPAAMPALATALAEGAPRLLQDTALWSQPGVFSWDRTDAGSALLARTLPPLAGRGADLGCGIGYLTRAILASPAISQLAGIDIDARAIACARRNVTDARAVFTWADARQPGLADLDFIVTNPPFHAEGTEDRSLGQTFITSARAALRRGGMLWLVANRHLPYEATLASAFRRVAMRADEAGFKVFEAHA